MSRAARKEKEQVGFRLDRDLYEVLEAIAYLRAVTPTGLARSVVEDFVKRELEENKRIDQLRRLRAEDEAEKSGELASMARRRSKSRDSAS